VSKLLKESKISEKTNTKIERIEKKRKAGNEVLPMSQE
jgi:hypothetical protein